MVLLVFPLFGTARFDETMKALRALRVPAGLIQLALFSYRWIYVWADEQRRLRTALRARGFRGRPFIHALRTAGNGLGMLLVRSIERTQKIQDAMRARGQAGQFHTLYEFRTTWKDILKTSAAAAAAALIISLGPFIP